MEILNKIKVTEYQKAVENLAINNSDLVFNNSSPLHASIVLSTMIRHSESEFRIYDDNLSGDIADLNEEFYTNLDDFIKSNKILKIVIDSNHNDYKETRIYKQLIDYKNKFPQNVFIKISNDSFKETIKKVFDKNVNFAIGDKKSFRIEDILQVEKGLRKAICCFNNPKVSEKLVASFDNSFINCQSI